MATNIVVVDDSQVERVFVEGLLRKNPDYRIQTAADGKEALAMIEAAPPDLVITDLVMPEMNGLELVRTMRTRHPEIPVILLTAYGDESTAVEALDAGAASYVPKARKAERLMAAVERVLERAARDRNREQLAQSMLEFHCRFALKNDLRMIRELVSQVQLAMAGIGFGDTIERIRLGEALEEALLNAMYHGNLEIRQEELDRARSTLDERELDKLVSERCLRPHIRDRRIFVVTHVTADEVRFVIRDQGRGFGSTAVAAADQPHRFEHGRNRGHTLMRSLMDEVVYNQAGNELVLRKFQHGSSAREKRSSMTNY